MEVEYVVANGDIVVFAGVQDREVWPGFGDDRLSASQVVGADREDFGTCSSDLGVVFLQLT